MSSSAPKVVLPVQHFPNSVGHRCASGIHALPNEVLQQIHNMTLWESENQWNSWLTLGSNEDLGRAASPGIAAGILRQRGDVMLVCRLWQELVQRNPRIWSMIYWGPQIAHYRTFDDDSAYGSATESDEGNASEDDDEDDVEAGVEGEDESESDIEDSSYGDESSPAFAFAELARNTPLRLVLQMEHASHKLRQFLVLHSSKVISAVIVGLNPMITGLDWSSLRQLSISYIHVPFMDFSNVRSLCIRLGDGLRPERPGTIFLQQTRLESLTKLSMPYHHIDSIFPVLRNCRSLDFIKLSSLAVDRFIKCESIGFISIPNVHFEGTEAQLMTLLQGLNPATIKRLKWERTRKNHEEIPMFSRVCHLQFPALTHFELQNWGLRTVPDDQAFTRLFGTTPCLESFAYRVWDMNDHSLIPLSYVLQSRASSTNAGSHSAHTLRFVQILVPRYYSLTHPFDIESPFRRMLKGTTCRIRLVYQGFQGLSVTPLLSLEGEFPDRFRVHEIGGFADSLRKTDGWYDW
ncbi:hypothetical protein DL93DRAFT_2169510 [Clavulina sp. PMI_390]|nr:hypothetical protein DL93DRAFT_2169510 [Clavulina sp. PMI_390]